MQKAVISFFLIITLFSCQKDDIQKIEPQIFSLLGDNMLTIDTVAESANTWVYGFKFKPQRNGKISQIGMKVPAIGTFSVKLIDLDKNEIISESNLSSQQEHKEVYQKISDVNVTTQMNLGLILKANSFYRVRRAGNQDFVFPMVVKDIVITSFNEVLESDIGNKIFPDKVNNKEIAPCVDIVFIDQ